MNTRFHVALVRLTLAVLLLGACVPLDPGDGAWLKVSDPELSSLVEAADKRWEKAGVSSDRIEIVPAVGIPVRWATAAECASRCGQSDPAGGCLEYLNDVPVRMWISSEQTRESSLRHVTHELGHLLGVLDHLADGNMMDEDGAEQISEADITAACDVGECDGFAPEE